MPPFDGYSKALAEFVKCCEAGKPLPRIYKPSGIARDGTRFEPYLRLRLHHHHLGRSGDPLLVTQHVQDDIISIALATHASYLQGDKMSWLQLHIVQIDWTGCEDLRVQVETHRA